MKRVWLGCVVLALIGVGALAWLVVAYPNRPPEKRPYRTVALELRPNAALENVAAELGNAGLVAEPRVFAWYARVLGAQARLRQGRVLVTTLMTARQLLQRIATGYGSTPLRITLPEGYNHFDVAQRLADWNVCSPDAFNAALTKTTGLPTLDPQATSGDGYLFPDTYWLRDEMKPEQVAQRLFDNAKRRLETLLASEAEAFEQLRARYGFGVREWVILASIVEKEAHFADEQPLIAGVFLNRLSDPSFKPKRLQADPTVAYGCLMQRSLPSCAAFDGKHVTRSMLADPQNSWNTYRMDGLPPSPISNPGLSALRAVLRPAQHAYFYFVARNDGRHTFSTTLSAHSLAVQRAGPLSSPQ